MFHNQLISSFLGLCFTVYSLNSSRVTFSVKFELWLNIKLLPQCCGILHSDLCELPFVTTYFFITGVWSRKRGTCCAFSKFDFLAFSPFSLDKTAEEKQKM